MPDFTKDKYNTITGTAYDTLTDDIGKILPKFPEKTIDTNEEQ